MKHRKINYKLANQLATTIADKAFEHLLGPAGEALQAVAREAYAKIEATLDLRAAAKIGLADQTQSVALDIRSSVAGRSDIVVCTGQPGYTTCGWRHIELIDDELYARAAEASACVQTLYKSRFELVRELQAQLAGKTTKQALEAWPEAAEIIVKVANLDGASDSFTKPLEVLLAKFLPALPAPTTQGV